MDRRMFLALALAGSAPSTLALAQSAPMPADLLGATGEAYFIDWLNGFYQRALAAGVPRALLDHELSGLSADPRITALDAQQPEFARPISAYIEGTVSQKRIELGRDKRVSVAQFATIERTYGVPRDILIAVWAMESNFGALQGDFDILRCLATLAAAGRRRAWAEGELLACLKIIGDGDAPRWKLRGSWAGAMGQTQFLPSTYLATAVDGDGDGRRDIWGSAPDALASAANLLAKGGWRRDEGWAYEVVLSPADDTAWSAADAASPAMLLLPAGADGPAFLALPNHFAIRTYNNSIAYALAVGLLADRFAGGGPLRTPWPQETPLSLTDRLDTQSALIRLGFNPGPADGAIGLMTRQALRAWQKTQGLPADGYLSPAIVARLRKSM
jgi:membrane-bound lytic murein transglycosylase B